MACSNKFIKGCAGKSKYKTYMIAEYVFNNSTTDKNAEIYECSCGYFHIGTQAKNKSKKVKEINNRKQKGNNEHKRKYKNVRKFKY